MFANKNGNIVLLVILSVFCLSFWLPGSAKGYMVNSDPNRRAEFLDLYGKYHLEWTVDRERSRITFNVTVKTQGWILFGLANNAEASTGKDVVVGGVMGRHGAPYFSDRHEEKNGGLLAILDSSQDYKLEDGWESRTETFLSFSRSLDTCDDEDYPISDNKATVIWEYGEIDDYEMSRGEAYHGQRGSYELYLLEPEYTPRMFRDHAGNPGLLGETIVPKENHDLQLWTISTSTQIPSAHTSYLCTMYKAPRLNKKHHVIGFDLHFLNRQSQGHVHHLTLYRCHIPPSMLSQPDPFENFVNAPAESCYNIARPPKNARRMPVHLCNEPHSGWALGGRAFFLPPEAGLVLGEDRDEYYMLQVHYDNPQQKSDLEVRTRFDLWYTPHLRPNDAGFMGVGISTLALPPTIVVPPKTSNYRVLGHCSGECTQRMYPPEGITVFAGLLHSHNSGKAMRLRHFDKEKNVELPWILYDDNYSFVFQQFRNLPYPTRVLPGDQLTMECTYDNTKTNGSVIGGFSTAQEMCSASLFYYGRIQDYDQCRSDIVSESGRRRFLGGAENMTWVESRTDWVATSPRRLAGLTATEISDKQAWDNRQREELQRYQITTDMVGYCSRDLFTRSRESFRQSLENRAQLPTIYPLIEVSTKDDYSGFVGYPFEAKPYLPVKAPCISHAQEYRFSKIS